MHESVSKGRDLKKGNNLREVSRIERDSALENNWKDIRTIISIRRNQTTITSLTKVNMFSVITTLLARAFVSLAIVSGQLCSNARELLSCSPSANRIQWRVWIITITRHLAGSPLADIQRNVRSAR